MVLGAYLGILGEILHLKSFTLLRLDCMLAPIEAGSDRQKRDTGHHTGNNYFRRISQRDAFIKCG